MAKEQKKKRRATIGGQAVLEGVMMRGQSAYATAVRDPGGAIQVESERFVPYKQRSVAFRIPIVRGVLSFVTSLVMGFKTLNRATEVYVGEEEEPGKVDKWLQEKLHIDSTKIATVLGVVLGVALAIALFILAPNALTDLLLRVIPIDRIPSQLGANVLRNLISGALRIAIFVGYIAATSLLKDIKRLYRYHGAEHKVISCYEHGLEMTVENARTQSTIHDRCGTTFMVLVMIIAILFFSFFGWQTLWLRVLIRLAGIPLVAGISYEILQFLARFDNPFVRVLKAPGLALQKLTTREPDDSMLEVALTAFLTVQQLETDPETPTSTFVTFHSMAKVRKELDAMLSEGESAELLMGVLHLGSRTDLDAQTALTDAQYRQVRRACADRKSGMPLAYATHSVSFYGYELYVDDRVLIPRPDTERLAETAIEALKEYPDGADVLELCTGSGAVAIAMALGTNARVTATDVSAEALEVAEQNIRAQGANVELVQSDLFASPRLGEYDVIVANPPYISRADLAGLERSVRDYEPTLALDGGEDGLDFYRAIAREGVPRLRAGGRLIVEIGAGQLEAVQAIFGTAGSVVFDYNTPPVARCITWRKEEICLNA